MKSRFTITVLALVAMSVTAFGQAGEDLPAFGNILTTATTPSNGTNCIQTLTFGATITSGTFTLTFDGKTTAAITWTATDATLVSRIDTALEALPTIGTSGVTTTQGTISSGVNGTITVTHTGNRAKQVVPVMTVTNSLVGAAHTLTAAITTPGVVADGRIAPKGTLLVDTGTPGLYQNTGSPPNPVWTAVPTNADVLLSASPAYTGGLTGTGAVVETNSNTTASIASPYYATRSALTLTPSGTMDAAGNVVTPFRSDMTLTAGKTLGDGFFYGVNGKFIATTGSFVPPNAGRITGVNGKVDMGTVAITAGQISGVWADLAGSPTGSLGEINALRATNSMGVDANSLGYFNGHATYLFDISDGGTSKFVLDAGTGSGSSGAATGVAAKVLKVNVGGVTYYLPLFSGNGN